MPSYSLGMSALASEVVAARKDDLFVPRPSSQPPPIPEDATEEEEEATPLNKGTADWSPYRRILSTPAQGPGVGPAALAALLPPPSPRGAPSSPLPGPASPAPRRLPSPRRSTQKSRDAAAAQAARCASPRAMQAGFGRDVGASPPRMKGRKAALPPEARAPSPSPRRPASRKERNPGNPNSRNSSNSRADEAPTPMVQESPLSKPVPRTSIKHATSARLEQGMWSNNANVRRGAIP